MRQNSEFAALFFFPFFRSGHFDGRLETLHQRKDDDQILKKKSETPDPRGFGCCLVATLFCFLLHFLQPPMVLLERQKNVRCCTDRPTGGGGQGVDKDGASFERGPGARFLCKRTRRPAQSAVVKESDAAGARYVPERGHRIQFT